MDVTFVWKFHFQIIPNRCHTHFFRLPDMTSSLKLGINHLGRVRFNRLGSKTTTNREMVFVGGGNSPKFPEVLGIFQFLQSQFVDLFGTIAKLVNSKKSFEKKNIPRKNDLCMDMLLKKQKKRCFNSMICCWNITSLNVSFLSLQRLVHLQKTSASATNPWVVSTQLIKRK